MQRSCMDISKRNLYASIVPMVWLCSAATGQQFTLTDLGSLGGPSTGGFGINANQLVVGYSALSSADFHGFLWDSTMHGLTPLPGDTQSHALAINSSAQVVGVSYVLGGLTTHAVLWQNGTTTNLGDFAPRGINNAGTVVGYVSSAINGLGWVDRACSLSNGLLLTLPTLGGSFSYAYDLNDASQIVGVSYLAGEGARHAALWQNGQILDLGTLGGTNSQAYAINESAQVVGAADNAGGHTHAFLYQLNTLGQVTSRTDLGELGGGYSYAYDINNLAEAVGTSNSRALYWRQGALIDLNRRSSLPANWILSNAQAINDHGQIVGMGFYLGWPHAFLLTPAAPDFDRDGDVDQEDFAHFQRCYTGPGKAQADPQCWNALLDGDQDVDQADLTVFQSCFSGPDLPAQPDCWR